MAGVVLIGDNPCPCRVTRLEAEKMEDNIEFYKKKQRMYIEMKRQTVENFINKGLPIPENMMSDLVEMEQS